MKTYKDVTAEIKRLEAHAESLRKSEIAGVIARIKEAISVYGLTAEDLGLRASSTPAGPRAGGASKAAKESKVSVGVAKFRDPESGKTWTGRGKPPDWIKGAKDRSAFLISGDGSSGSAGSNGSGASTPSASAKPKRGQAAKAAKAVNAGVPKYRDAATGKTWTGRGKPPNWIVGAKDREAFLIDGSGNSAS